MIDSCPNCGSADVLDYSCWETGKAFIRCCDCGFGKQETASASYPEAVEKWSFLESSRQSKPV